jgi:hypothetical protein
MTPRVDDAQTAAADLAAAVAEFEAAFPGKMWAVGNAPRTGCRAMSDKFRARCATPAASLREVMRQMVEAGEGKP